MQARRSLSDAQAWHASEAERFKETWREIYHSFFGLASAGAESEYLLLLASEADMTTTERLVPPCTFKQLAGPEPWAGFRRTGLIRIRGAAHPPSVEAAREAGFEVFRHPELIDPACHRGNGETGYTPPGVEGVAGGPANTRRHFWDIRALRKEDNRRCAFTRRFVQSLEEVARHMSLAICQAMHHMDRHLPGLGIELYHVILHGDHGFRATHYPIADNGADLRFPRHRDRSLFTVFVGGSEAGLQVEIDGEWHDLENPPGDIVIMAGGMLRFWTGGPTHPDRIGAVPHRVRHDVGERLSLALFAEPASDTVMPNADGRTAGDYLAELVRLTRPRL
ncbi:isopenicillin N synthase family oxygenase [Candidatus Uhrbacteria bacterium]|nr:MAG: isopenicillin N synthase family oxygenase [Candidatus Uhrbacteria bacterium]